MPQKTKNQHYVPRTYLKHFATANSSDDKPCVNAYMKEEGKQLNNQPISEVTSAKWFYDFPGDENQTVENHLSKLEDRVGRMEWNVHKYSQDAFRFTSDNPLMLIPLARPANKNDREADGLLSLVWLGMVHFYIDEIIEEYPPMGFVLPLTPHLDLSIAPHGWMLASKELLGQRDASAWNRFQAVQAHRLIFSAQNDFSVVPKAVEDFFWHKRLIEQLIPARIKEEPHLNEKEPRHKRWIRF